MSDPEVRWRCWLVLYLTLVWPWHLSPTSKPQSLSFLPSPSLFHLKSSFSGSERPQRPCSSLCSQATRAKPWLLRSSPRAPCYPCGEIRNTVSPIKGHTMPSILIPSPLLPPWNPMTLHTLPASTPAGCFPCVKCSSIDLIQKLALCSFPDHTYAPFILCSRHSLPLTTNLKYPNFFPYCLASLYSSSECQL